MCRNKQYGKKIFPQMEDLSSGGYRSEHDLPHEVRRGRVKSVIGAIIAWRS